jgi:hypothetical protein
MFDLTNYMNAEERIELQPQDNPDFRYDSEHNFVTDPKGKIWVVVKAYIWRTYADAHPWVSGLAAESMDTPFAIEKAETSAYARAITNTGDPKYSTTKDGKKAPRANRGEMEKIARIENDKVTVKIQADMTQDWDNFLKEKPETVATLGQGVELVTKTLNATPLPSCGHGTMEFKSGTGKTGRPYNGYVCPSKDRSDQCSPIWLP